MDPLLRALKIFCVVAGILIIAGSATLAALLYRRSAANATGETALAVPSQLQPPPGGALKLSLPAGMRTREARLEGGHLVLLLDGDAGTQVVLIVDVATGARVARYDLVSDGQ